MVLREWIIDYFIGEPEEVTKYDELMFYLMMSTPVLIALIIFVIIL